MITNMIKVYQEVRKYNTNKKTAEAVFLFEN